MEREPVARTIYGWLTAIFMLAVVVQFFLAGAGVFRAGAGKAARESSTFDPHRALGDLIILLALLVLVAALAGRVGWRLSLVLLVACVVQLPLAHVSGWVGGLHPVVGLVIAAIGSLLAHRAFAGARRAARAT